MKLLSGLLFGICLYQFIGLFGLGDNTLSSMLLSLDVEPAIAGSAARITGVALIVASFGFHWTQIGSKKSEI